MFKLEFAVILSFFFGSCLVHNHAGSDKVDVCSVHKVKMNKALVINSFGKGCNNGNDSIYPNAKAKHRMGCIKPIWPKSRLSTVYHCKECSELKKLSSD